MSGAIIVARYALRECVRRRVLLVVAVLTAGFLALYALGTNVAFDNVTNVDGGDTIDEQVLTGSTLVGLSMFTTLFLGAVLAAFLTLSAVRGDAERGLLQPLVVRPVGRSALLLGRFAAAALVCSIYVLAVYAFTLVITAGAGGWWPDSIVGPGLALVVGVLVIAALSLLGSVFLTPTAQGIAVLMVFGAGLTAGLLGQIGHALRSDTLESIANVADYVLPFEALYQGGLHALISETSGLTGIVLKLGPFGGSQAAGAGLVVWALIYAALALGAATFAFGRRDL